MAVKFCKLLLSGFFVELSACCPENCSAQHADNGDALKNLSYPERGFSSYLLL
ncbi:hypothetical protein [Oxalobacter paraformigenes]|uniref:Uncharacterized protein n=1 Tax=Oxalobacter paraformigenes TaxID=556268 RepID=T5LEK7_9BURK|nr:hypothetical protein [Oxalobacter paraformigenes]EQM95306.1 hypothetical protein OFAG_02137 [Oxalobacter paraformigenes]